MQLRDPSCSDDELVKLGRRLEDELDGTGVPLLVNDRVHLVEAIGAHGAHVGQGDLPAAAAREALGHGRYLGLSVQTLEQVSDAARLPEDTLDYLGVGPIWHQTTKLDAGAPSSLQALGEVVRRSPWPCVAIGGIDASRAGLVRRAGAAGVAVVSAICGQPDPAAATRELRRAWEES